MMCSHFNWQRFIHLFKNMKNSVINIFNCSKRIVYFFYKILKVLFCIVVKSGKIGIDSFKRIKNSMRNFKV